MQSLSNDLVRTVQNSTLNACFRILGYLLFVLSIAMLITAVVSYNYAETIAWIFFADSLLIAFIASLLIINTKEITQFSKRYLFFITSSAWLIICFFSAIPLHQTIPTLSWTDAWFETVSAITTTGSTVLSGLNNTAKGVLFWRAILQWIGGVGIIVMAIAILPALKIGGMKLFKTESSDISDKAMPRSSKISSAILITYLTITILASSSYYFAGMNAFDAITHGMTTTATGGFSNYDESFGYFNSIPIMTWLASLWMLLAAMPFLLFVQMFSRDKFAVITDPQVKAFVIIVVGASCLLTFYQVEENQRDWFSALTHSVFNVISVITTCGYASEDYSLWGSVALIAFFYLTFSGGCSGSTSGGLKMFRTQLAWMLLKKQLTLLIHPNAIVTQKYGNKKINDELLGTVLAFCFIYFATIAILALILSFYHLDLLTALTGAATAVSNVGPGLGDIIGPAGNFSTLPDGAKLWLSVGMIMGRLEILTILILFTPQYWQY
ncbi:TrkH family potassium uptake protein [Catenovulum sp. 2E275]|uniref:TrkH family potassium uptake protein n=1 Tax=Catenovulum sp. 2E275 TaxID=2980497 RepID=UPI0021D27A3B|nr:TrkH family potassium uptake protein [Catenovulum sp. 2E275]MCU4677665.1 TrkH family potassium uptake protein [Catenovulum sp. 2E275]